MHLYGGNDLMGCRATDLPALSTRLQSLRPAVLPNEPNPIFEHWHAK